MDILRRSFAGGAALIAATLAFPALASSRRALPEMTDGPFYPPRAWREHWADQDADLAHVTVGGQVRSARGEHLGLELTVVDTAGRLLDGAEVELWQCDAMQAYRHPSVAAGAGRHDDGFQGFGASRSDGRGLTRWRTIRPVPYPGRTPHIHVKLRHPAFGVRTSQLFVSGDAGNANDFLWRSLAPAERAAVEMALHPAPPASGLRWQVRHTLVVPA